VLPSRPVPDRVRACGRARTRTGLLLLPVVLATSAGPLATPASAAEQVIERASVAGAPVPHRDGSTDASLSQDGRYVAFVRVGPQSGGNNRGTGGNDVYRHDRLTGETVLVSVTTSGTGGGGRQPSISEDGNRIAFTSASPDLVAGDSNGMSDVFVRDVAAGTTTRVSLAHDGAQSPASSDEPALSGDGTTVAFTSPSALTADDTNGTEDVFVRVLASGLTERVSVLAGGAQGGRADDSGSPALSRDGRHVAFRSEESLTADDTNAVADAYHRDRGTGTTTRASRLPSSSPYGVDLELALSGDGTAVAFATHDGSLTTGDTNDVATCSSHRLGGTTTRASLGSTASSSLGQQRAPALDETGSVVVFQSDAAWSWLPATTTADRRLRRNARPGRPCTSRPPGPARRRSTAAAPRRPSAATAPWWPSSPTPRTSPPRPERRDGRRLVRAAGTTAPLVITELDEDREARGSQRATPTPAPTAAGSSSTPAPPTSCRAAGGRPRRRLPARPLDAAPRPGLGRPGGAVADGGSADPSVSADGRFVAFTSWAGNLVEGDTNGVNDVFVRDMQTGETRRVSVDSAGGEAEGSSVEPPSPTTAPASPSVVRARPRRRRRERPRHWTSSCTTGPRARPSWPRATPPACRATGTARAPSLSADGTRVAFASPSTNLVPGDGNGTSDVFVRDLTPARSSTSRRRDGASRTERSTQPPSAPTAARSPSRLGRRPAAGDANETQDVFVRDLTAGTTTRVSQGSTFVEYGEAPSISPDGTAVAFVSNAGASLEPCATTSSSAT
jgi:Tol biopolymer transport system component